MRFDELDWLIQRAEAEKREVIIADGISQVLSTAWVLVDDRLSSIWVAATINTVRASSYLRS